MRSNFQFCIQTTFIENLIIHKKLEKIPRKIYYIYPKELGHPPVHWDQTFPEIDVEFIADLPTYASFWSEIKKDSLVCIDDLWSSACNNEHISNCFKVYSKKYRFSIAIVTQNFFEAGKYSQNIRQNSEVVCLFENYGNYLSNKIAVEKLGFGQLYQEAADYAYNHRYGYIMINKSPSLPSRKFRMCTNLFGEFSEHPFTVFFCTN